MGRLHTLFAETYSLMTKIGIDAPVLSSIPESLNSAPDKFVVIELPLSIQDLCIGGFSLSKSYVKISFYSKDKSYLTSRMPNIEELERMYNLVREVLPFVGTGYSLMFNQSVQPPRKADIHFHYMVALVPIVFK